MECKLWISEEIKFIQNLKLKANNNLNTTDISRLIPGVYFVRINCGEKVFVSKLVKL